MPVVIVEMWEGRSVEQKRQLVKGITSSFVQLGIPSEVVHVILKDNPKSNWGTAGKLVSETPPGA